MDAKKNRKTLSKRFPVMTLNQARTEALDILRKTGDGVDVNRVEQKKKASTLGAYLGGEYGDYAKANIVTHKPMIAGLKTGFDFSLKKPTG